MSSGYTRPKGVMGGPCLNCGGSQPEHVGKTCDEVRATRESAFRNLSTKRMWTEEECRQMLNAALLYLAEQAGGRLDIPTDEMLKACERAGGGVAMALSDDDKTLTITRMPQQ